MEPNRLRNVVLAGHAGSGKTTLAERLLHSAGAIGRLGRVDEGTASLDFEPEEQKRHLSLALAVASLEHDGHRVTLVDTPGYADFVGEMIQGFAAADAALISMDASGSVEAGTEKAVQVGRETGLPALFVITRCERENADPGAALDRLRESFGQKIAPLHVAIGAADSLRGYVDLVHRVAYTWQGDQVARSSVPAELEEEVARRREQLVEAASEASDDIMTKYLEGEEIGDEELETCVRDAVRRSLIAPVVVTSAARGIGVTGLLDAIVAYLPSPVDRGPVAALDAQGRPAQVAPDPTAPLLLHVFRTTADPFVGRLTFFRVLSGTIRSHDHVWNPNRGEEERIGQVLALHGKEQEAVGELGAGEIGAVAKLTATLTGDTLTSRERPLTMSPLAFPAPTLAVAIEPQTKADMDKMGQALGRLVEEEPTVRVERQSETGEQLLWTVGENQIQVLVELLKRKFGAAVVTRPPRIPYRETIRGHTQVEGRHKKQTGGHGQFGHVWIEIQPNPGAGVEFAEHVVGGVVPKQFFPGVEKGVRDVASKGVIAGYPVVDFKATLYDGSFHPVDSDELSFRLAATMATRKGLMDANPVLLEPIMDVTIRVPEAFMGDVNRDLNTRRGRVLGMDSEGAGIQVVHAQVPEAELATYATELRAFTAGRGMFSATLDHYEEVPPHIAQKVVEAHKKEEAAA
ncbi:MAG TPA: elongation factor G, partial [Candidatus Acidoferrales bacterium]|nr:elongation factor G [Candidatus Acidoferrales bacterium]